jgi:hypothetical protein
MDEYDEEEEGDGYYGRLIVLGYRASVTGAVKEVVGGSGSNSGNKGVQGEKVRVAVINIVQSL